MTALRPDHVASGRVWHPGAPGPPAVPGTRRRPRPIAAFTLIELIVAMTVTVLVSGATVLLVRNLTATQRRAEHQGELQQEARAASVAVATALRNAYRPPPGEQRDAEDRPLLVGEAGWRGDLPDDRVRLLGVSHRTIRPGEPESDVREVEFRLLEVEGREHPVLTRRTDPALLEPEDRGGVLERVARNVAALEISYFDGLRWRQDWHSHDDGWPLAMRIEMLVISDPDHGPAAQWPVTRLVNFPHHTPGAGEAGRGQDD